MTKKKPLFLLMALLMLASLVSPASAAETGNRASTEIEAVCSRLPEIRVTVPPAMDVLINPYKIPVVVQDKQVRYRGIHHMRSHQVLMPRSV